MACTQCTNGCTGACAPGCTGCRGSCRGGCSNSCTGGCGDGCSSSCTGCTNSCSGCTGSCTGSCKGTCSNTCTGSCTEGCIGYCTNTCEGLCASGCKDSAMGVNLTTKIEASNISTIADLIILELSRRPNTTITKIPSINSGDLSVISELEPLIQDFSQTGEEILCQRKQNSPILRALGEEIIDKLLQVNSEFIPQV